MTGDDVAKINEGSGRRAELMRRAQSGDQDAYRVLLEELAPLLDRVLRRWAPDAQDRDDLVQETLIAVHRARHTYDPSRPLEPWLFAIARHIASDYRRRHSARLRRETPLANAPEQIADSEGDALARLEEVLASLPPAQREAFSLLKLEGLSLAAGAARAGTSTGALKLRAHRAYTAIKALLRGDGG